MGHLSMRPPSCVLLLLLLLRAVAASVEDVGSVLHSLRRALREKDAALRATRRARSVVQSPRQLHGSVEPTADVCSSEDCQLDVTTGIAGWLGAHATPREFHWARVEHGQWIGDSSQTAPGFLVASVSFEITEPSCASFDLPFAADGEIISAELNGRPLAVPHHGFREVTGESDGSHGLVAERGAGAFAYGTNSLVISVASDAGAIGLYVTCTVQLLCPLHEATVSMSPSSGPTAGSTMLTIMSSVRLYVKHEIWCRVGKYSLAAVVIDGSTVRCPTPPLLHAPRGWADVEVVTSHQGSAAVGVHYQGQHLAGKFYYHSAMVVSSVTPATGPTAGGSSVALHGQFEHLGALRCRFGTHSLGLMVPRLVDATRIECTSAPQAVPGYALVQVTTNGQQFSESDVLFAYHEPLYLMSLAPPKVKTEGGTVVTLRANRGLPAESRGCRFCSR
jgi:hypothetical protein